MVTNPIALALFGIYLAVVGGLSAVQRDLLYIPDTDRPNIESTGLSSLQEVELVTSDGLRLLGWYLPPTSDGPIVVYFHGNGGGLQNRVPRLVEFAKAGFGVLMPEYRGYGGNEGNPTESGLYFDADAAMEFVRGQGINANRIVVYGESLGSGVATYVASQQALGALVLESPYTSMTELIAEKLPRVPARALVKDRYDSLSRIGLVRAPTLIMHGEQDPLVPFEMGRRLFAATPDPKEFWSAAQGSHNDLSRFGAIEVAIDFIKRHVPATAPAVAALETDSESPEPVLELQ